MGDESAVSNRAIQVINYPDDLLKYEEKVKEDPYGPQNQQGIVDIGLAENRVCEDMMRKKLTELLPKEVELDELHYFTNHGTISFRKAIKNFLNNFFNPLDPINEDDLVVVTGVTCLLDLVAFGLAEEGEYFLCPAPYYSRIRNDMYAKSRVLTHDVDIRCNDSYHITDENLQAAYDDAEKMGRTIKGIMIINPNNPTGQILTEEEIQTVLHFANQHNIHAVFDEIYCLSVHKDGQLMRSVCSVYNPNPEKTHFMWGLSKDLGLSGFRCGVLHSKNKQLLQFIKKVAFFSALPLFIQNRLTSLLNKTDWLRSQYFPTVHEEMKFQYKMATVRLEERGVKIHHSGGGFFIWANFSKFMRDNTEKCEQELFDHFFKYKVFFARGTTFYSKELGWFRIIFTQPLENLMVGLDRIEEALNNLPIMSK